MVIKRDVSKNLFVLNRKSEWYLTACFRSDPAPLLLAHTNFTSHKHYNNDSAWVILNWEHIVYLASTHSRVKQIYCTSVKIVVRWSRRKELDVALPVSGICDMNHLSQGDMVWYKACHPQPALFYKAAAYDKKFFTPTPSCHNANH